MPWPPWLALERIRLQQSWVQWWFKIRLHLPHYKWLSCKSDRILMQSQTPWSDVLTRSGVFSIIQPWQLQPSRRIQLKQTEECQIRQRQLHQHRLLSTASRIESMPSVQQAWTSTAQDEKRTIIFRPSIITLIYCTIIRLFKTHFLHLLS